ncbi:hypothetical protein [Enterococcus crotali]|uniref:hypothetical protein n=1 Tax=Enterococcus crotali TaxID=1453587 RepID=UPI00046F4F83|nr:hypothetical protein [Enterococcus crotali]
MNKKIFQLIDYYYPKGISYELSVEQKLFQVANRETKINKSRNSDTKEQLLVALRKIFSEYNVIDMVDEESCCYEFDILLKKNQPILDNDRQLIEKLGNTRYDIRIFFSCLGDYYYYFIDKTKYHPKIHTWEFTTKEIHYNVEIKNKLKEMENYFARLQYELLSNELVRLPVKEVETYYKEKNDVIVFDCLFTDLVTLDNNKKSIEGYLAEE